jgi:peptide-methionine (S)-S-oxide reductase
MITRGRESATLGGGCFWCLEAAYEEIAGVLRIESGYAGGSVADPTYDQVCSGTTGHAEVVRLAFVPAVISFRDILEIFFTIHDPTTRNRQGADAGTQYRSVIYYHDEEQRKIAEAVIEELGRSGVYRDPIVTELAPASEFYPAEPYHRQYYRSHPEQAYCQAVIEPKLAKLRKYHFERLRRTTEDDDGFAASGRSGDRSRSESRSADRGRAEVGQVKPYQGERPNPIDQGGIAD